MHEDEIKVLLSTLFIDHSDRSNFHDYVYDSRSASAHPACRILHPAHLHLRNLLAGHTIRDKRLKFPLFLFGGLINIRGNKLEKTE